MRLLKIFAVTLLILPSCKTPSQQAHVKGSENTPFTSYKSYKIIEAELPDFVMSFKLDFTQSSVAKSIGTLTISNNGKEDVGYLFVDDNEELRCGPTCFQIYGLDKDGDRVDFYLTENAEAKLYDIRMELHGNQYKTVITNIVLAGDQHGNAMMRDVNNGIAVQGRFKIAGELSEVKGQTTIDGKLEAGSCMIGPALQAVKDRELKIMLIPDDGSRSGDRLSLVYGQTHFTLNCFDENGFGIGPYHSEQKSRVTFAAFSQVLY